MKGLSLIFTAQSQPWPKHVFQTGHKIAWEDSKIITTSNPDGQQRCLEA